MPNRPIDLRSDTVTRPTAGMREAIASADVGDDQFGEDPTVRALEEQVAARFGHEAAVFVPSGTMGNNIALRLLADRGEEVIADNESHIVAYEMGAVAAIGGIQTRTVTSRGGVFGPEVLAPQLRVDPSGPNTNGKNYSMVATKAVAIENTHVRSGGHAWTLAEIDALVALCEPLGVSLHCDGARIWNASVALGVSLEEYGRRFSTLSVCLSKGLGAPVGSLVVSSAENAGRARLMRRQLGGAMRQSGILAAAGIYALEHHLERLADDHRRAAELASALAAHSPDAIRVEAIETNVVLFEVSEANVFVTKAAELGVRVGAISPTTIRALTHLEIDDEQIQAAGEILGSLLEADGKSRRAESGVR